MRQDVKSLSSRIDEVMQLCKKVLDCGEKIKELSPLDIGMESYAEELILRTEERGRATRLAVQELNTINGFYEAIEKDPATTASEKAFLKERMSSIHELLSPLFAKQNVVIRKSIEVHLNSLRKESAEFRHNVGIIKNYLKAPDNRNFYG